MTEIAPTSATDLFGDTRPNESQAEEMLQAVPTNTAEPWQHWRDMLQFNFVRSEVYLDLAAVQPHSAEILVRRAAIAIEENLNTASEKMSIGTYHDTIAPIFVAS